MGTRYKHTSEAGTGLGYGFHTKEWRLEKGRVEPLKNEEFIFTSKTRVWSGVWKSMEWNNWNMEEYGMEHGRVWNGEEGQR